MEKMKYKENEVVEMHVNKTTLYFQLRNVPEYICDGCKTEHLVKNDADLLHCLECGLYIAPSNKLKYEELIVPEEHFQTPEEKFDQEYPDIKLAKEKKAREAAKQQDEGEQ